MGSVGCGSFPPIRGVELSILGDTSRAQVWGPWVAVLGGLPVCAHARGECSALNPGEAQQIKLRTPNAERKERPHGEVLD